MTAFAQDDFDALLEDISDAFTNEVFSQWNNRILRPFSMVTQSGPVTLITERDVIDNFEQYLVAKRAMGLDLVVREAISIEHCADGTVLATYRTNLLRANAQRIVDPYTSTALLQPCPDGVWRMSAVLNALGHHHWTGQNPLSAETVK